MAAKRQCRHTLFQVMLFGRLAAACRAGGQCSCRMSSLIPVLGRVDDAILVPLGVLTASRLMPPEVLDEHRRRAMTLAGASTDWRADAAVIVLWALAAALVARWIIVAPTAT